MLRRLLRHPRVLDARERLRRAEKAFRSSPEKDRTDPIQVTPTSSYWVFLADSDEPRHLFDIVLGAQVLRKKKIPDDRIHICTNHIGAAQHLHPYNLRNIHPIGDLDRLLDIAKCEVLVVVVGGHGTPDGVGQTARVVAPDDVITKVRAIQGLKAGVIVLNQCFAGVFNLLDASTKPPLVLIGATNLNSSISTPITLPNPLPLADGTAGVQNWSANLFSLSFFRWIETQPDIDGDGRLTILDAYKFAGAASNQQLIDIKSRLFVESLAIAEHHRSLVRQHHQHPPPQNPQDIQAMMQRVVTIKAVEARLTEVLKILHLHQEPWILHATLARRLEVGLP